MNSPRSIALLTEIGPSVNMAGSRYVAAQGDGATPLQVAILSAVVAVGLFIAGWKLQRHLRQRDHQRADLTDLAQIVRNVHVQLQLLADQDSMATVTDCVTLRTLKYELGGAVTTEAATAVRTLITCLDAVLATALPVTPGAGTATLAQARTQGRAIQEALAAAAAALEVISRLRSR